MATTDELVAQAQAADTNEQLDAIQAQSQDAAVAQAVQDRRGALGGQANATPAVSRAADTQRVLADNPNLKTEPDKPKEHYYLAQDGKTKINAWGEEKGSAEDKKRMASI